LECQLQNVLGLPYDPDMAAARTDVTPNRRGTRSREAVLDAAERVMATKGYDGASINAIVAEARIPASSVYHYFGSKDGILLAVMERGAQRFFASVPPNEQRLGGPVEHLTSVTQTLVGALEDQPDFLRLLVAMSVQPPATSADETRKVVSRVRATALERLRSELTLAFDLERPEDADRLARLALALIDGAFVATQADPKVRLADLLGHVPVALAAVRASLDAP
jgi:AcrR family transcriptional regulator